MHLLLATVRPTNGTGDLIPSVLGGNVELTSQERLPSPTSNIGPTVSRVDLRPANQHTTQLASLSTNYS